MRHRRSTGIYDKNDRLIYEGDIIVSKNAMVNLMTNRPTGEIRYTEYLVKWETPKARWGRWNIKNEKFELLSGLHQNLISEYYTIKEESL